MDSPHFTPWGKDVPRAVGVQNMSSHDNCMKSYKSLICIIFHLFLNFSINNTLSDAAKFVRLLRYPG